MDYYDDLLNVYGYLRAKSRAVSNNLNTAILYEKQTKKQTAAIDVQLDRITQMLSRTAESYGIQVKLKDHPDVLLDTGMKDMFKKIVLPGDIDYEREYQTLVAEAKAAGFINVHPEELLNAEEMAFAEEYSRKLDQQFADVTQLTMQDMFVVGVGVFLHLLRISLSKLVVPLASLDGHDQFVTSEPEIVGDRNAKNLQELFEVVKELNNLVPNKNCVCIKEPAQILADPPFFQCFSDKRYPNKKSVLGYNPILGWLFGVYNVMTDTVTFSDMHTFLPEPATGINYLTLSKDYLPLRDVMAPFAVGGLSGKRDQIIAGVIREAYVLIPQEIDFAGAAQHYEYCKNLSSMVSQGADVINTFQPIDGINQIFSQAGWASVINTILIALHGLFCKNGEDVKTYMVKTMKVVTIANAVSSAVGSLHVLVDQNYLGADWGGLLTSLIELTHMTRLWIDVKAKFLTSAYLPKLQEQLNELDQYFETQ